MGRSRLLSVLTATILSVGALSLPATAVELTDATVTETTDTVTDTTEAVSETTTIVEDETETGTDNGPVEEAVDTVVTTAEEVLEDPEGTVEDVLDDPAGEVEDLLDPVAGELPLPGSSDDGDTETADDGDVEAAPEPAEGERSQVPSTSPSPSFDHMLTQPSMDHGVTASPGNTRPAVAEAAPADMAPEVAAPVSDVAIQAAAPDGGPFDLPATVPALLRALTAMLVAGAMVTWRTVHKELGA